MVPAAQVEDRRLLARSDLNILLTGAAGFIGHHVAEHYLRNTDHRLVFLDRLDCAGNQNRLAEIANWQRHKTRCKFVWHDLKAPISDHLASQIGPVDEVLHMAASTHVDRSITDPLSFVYDNVIGTANLLEYVRKAQPGQVLFFSTDEVFGPAPQGAAYKEWDRYNSGNPYSASKAGAEELCLAYHNTYRVPVMVTHCMNVFGERQAPEKMIPMTIRKVRDGEKVTVHADKTCKRAGSRFYIHARNVADAVAFVLTNGTPGGKYNIAGEREVDNLSLAKAIAEVQGKRLDYEMVDFHSSRPGHDLRYALDGTVLAGMGWKPPVTFEKGLERVVKWSLANPRWL